MESCCLRWEYSFICLSTREERASEDEGKNYDNTCSLENLFTCIGTHNIALCVRARVYVHMLLGSREKVKMWGISQIMYGNQ